MTDTVYVTVPDGRTLAFAEWGAPDGRPLFVLHGAPGSRYGRHIGGVYDRQQVRVITYDRPGYGKSTRRRGVRIADAAEDVALIADHLGIDQGCAGVLRPTPDRNRERPDCYRRELQLADHAGALSMVRR